MKNALKGTNLESPIDPFGGKDHFDISKNGLVFTAKDPDLNPATHTKTNIYVAATDESFWDNLNSGTDYKVEKVTIDGFEGASTNPTWSNSGKMIAFLSMRTDGYESDKNQPFIIHDYKKPSQLTPVFASKDGKGKWDRSPQSLAWSLDDWHMYFLAEEHGRTNLYRAGPPRANDTDSDLPCLIVQGGSISAIKVLIANNVFLTSTSLIENSLYSMYFPDAQSAQSKTYTLPIDDRPSDPNADSPTTKYISSMSRSGSMFGLSRRQITEIHWDGAASGTSVHAWVVKPSNFSSDKKYPLAFLVHGGPQGAWLDGWSTRWVSILAFYLIEYQH